jgi:hypothetical protein
MTTQSLNIPINIPWKLVAASQDMMDTQFNNVRYPPPWRSSFAIYAYEVPVADVDPSLCDQRITFLKVTCSITGIQYTGDEKDHIFDWLTENVGEVSPGFDALGQAYLACYGVLLNVAVMPNKDKVALQNYPHIIDFEPKKRDIYQAATVTGEILTASRGSVQTGKSFTDTLSSETGITPKAIIPLGEGKDAPTIGAELSQKWGNTSNDNWTTNTDSSRESRETHGTTTNITQMYNLITGYHAGTNRATFLMLPRPHTIQPTDKRTFVNGLREIEGLQDFFLIVSRPKDLPGLCVEAKLETGHFKELAPMVELEGAYTPIEKHYEIDEEQAAGWGVHRPLNITETFPKPPGTEFDYDNPGADNDGLVHEEILDLYDNKPYSVNEHEWLEIQQRPSYEFTATGDFIVKAAYMINGPILGGIHSFRFHRKYTVYLKKRQGSGAVQQTDRESLYIAQRSLAVCIQSDDKGCITSEQLQQGNYFDLVIYPGLEIPNFGSSIPEGLMTSHLATQWLMQQMTAARSPRKAHRGGLLFSDFTARRLARVLPSDIKNGPLNKRLEKYSDALHNIGVTTVEQLLRTSESRLSRRLGIPLEEAQRLRLAAIGLSDAAPKSDESDEQGT